MWRWAKRFVLGLLVLVVVAIVFVVIAARTEWGREQVRSRAEAALRDAFPGGASIGRIEGNLLGTFTVHDLVIHDVAGQPAITVASFEAELSLRALAGKTVRVETAIADGVTVRIGAARLTPPPVPTPEPSEPSGWSIELPAFELRGGTVEIAKGYPIELDQITLAGALAIDPGEPVVAELSTVKALWRERAQQIELRAKVAIGAEILIEWASGTVGGAQLAASELVVDATQPSGKLDVKATVEAISALVPGGIELPVIDDLALRIDATPPPLGRFGTQLRIAGTLGSATVNGALHADLGALSASGWIGLGATDLGKLTKAKVRGRGEAALAIAVDRAGARGIASVRGELADYPAGSATMFLDAKFSPGGAGTAEVAAIATSGGDVRSATTAAGGWTKTTAWLDRGRAIASASDLAPVAKVPLTGALRADVELVRQATLVPELAVDVKGKATATNASYEDQRVARVDSTVTGKVRGRTVTATTTSYARGIATDGEPVGDADIDANLLADRRIFSRVTARPVAADLEAYASGYVTLGDGVTTVALEDHEIRPKVGAKWVGRGGKVEITDAKVAVTGFTTTNGDGSARADVTYLPASGALDVALDARQLPASAIDASYRGTASGKLTAKRRGTRWDGAATFDADRLVFDPAMPVLDGDGRLALRGRELELTARAESPDVGLVRLEIAAEAPRDLLDPIAWRRLQRTAIRRATIDIEKLELASFVETGGSVKGQLAVEGNETTGKLDVRKVETVVGTAEGELVVAPFLDKHLGAVWNARVTDLGEGNVVVQVKFPDYPFDPAAWRQLGRNALLVLSANFEDVVVDPAKLAKLGVDAKYQGRAHLNVKIAEGASVGIVTVAARGVSGEQIAKPIDAHVFARTDERGTTAHACVVLPGGSCPEADGVPASTPSQSLVDVADVALPVTFGQWLSNPKGALAAKLSGRVVVPKQAAPPLLAILGRKDFDPRTGTAEGTISVGGTLLAPTATGGVTMRNLDILSTIAGRDIPELIELSVTGSWDAKTADVKLLAVERDGRLTADVHVDPERLGEARAAVTAVNVELAPLAAFLPGELAASSGRMKGNLRVASFDPPTMEVRGDLNLEHAYVPLTPMIGTLRDGRATLAMTDAGIKLDAKGSLNNCRGRAGTCTENMTLELRAPNDVSRIDGDLVVRRVSPLAEIEPVIDGKAHIALVRGTGFYFGGKITISNGYVFVPPRSGDDLLDADDLPDDVFIVEDGDVPPESSFRNARMPVAPWLVADVELEPTTIEVEEYGVFASVASRELRLKIGDGIGLDGQIVVERGVANDVFGRQYTIRENALLDFDGTIDPKVALFMSYEFKVEGLMLTMSVEGRLSDRDFPNPRFTSNRNDRYSEGELFGFFLGGSPGGTGDATTAARDAAISAPQSLVSQWIAKRVKGLMPRRLRLDVIKCEPGTSAAGASCTVGKRFLDGKFYVAYKRRLTALPNENADEIQGQYYLSREWFLEGAGGSSNIIGADLLWRRRW